MRKRSARQRLVGVLVGSGLITGMLAGCAETMGGDASPATTLSATSADGPAEPTVETTSTSGPESAAATQAPPMTTILTETVTSATTVEQPTPVVPPAAESSAAPSSVAAPSAPVTDLAGEVYAYITGVTISANTIDVDVIQWFTDQAALDACAEDGVEPVGVWCSAYYFRNTNPQLRTLAVSPTASVQAMPGGNPQDRTSVSLEGLLARIGQTSSAFFRIVVQDGVVVVIDEIYTP